MFPVKTKLTLSQRADLKSLRKTKCEIAFILYFHLFQKIHSISTVLNHTGTATIICANSTLNLWEAAELQLSKDIAFTLCWLLPFKYGLCCCFVAV